MDKRKVEDKPKITGYFPGSIGKITTLHAVYYKEYWGLDHSFEAQVGREVSDFITHFDGRKDGLWNALSGNDLAGCIAITKDPDEPSDARLRWYIVDPAFHGQGVGKTLIKRAINFCRDAGYKRIYLWTFKGLNRAQSIYEQNGFKLTEERDVEQWGGIISEQRFDLVLK
jgi:GNAT superfamily N-acetyltransferase